MAILSALLGPPADSAVHVLFCIFTKAQERIGLKIRNPLGKGLAEASEFIKKHLNLFKSDQYSL